MKLKKTAIIIKSASVFLLFLIYPLALNAELAIVPYRVEDPSVYLSADAGFDYSRLLSIVAIKKKGIDVSSPVDIELDLKRLGRTPGSTISEEDLLSIGKRRHLDFIMTGTIYLANGKYSSESVLYSVRDRRLLFRQKTDSYNIFTLAEKEIGDAFVNLPDVKKMEIAESASDIAFIVDLSYNVNSDWPLISAGISEFASNLIERKGSKTRITVIPFSDSGGTKKIVFSNNSIQALKGGLARLKPSGGNSAGSFEDGLRYANGDVRWSGASEKKIIIISNSKIDRGGAVERLAASARKKGIKIYTVTLGNLKGSDTAFYKKISTMGGGAHINVSYHKRIFDTDANPVELYFENGRLFSSRMPYKGWKGGLFDSSSANYSKPWNNFNEIFYDDEKTEINPSNMSVRYSKASNDKIINEYELENNIDAVLSKISDSAGVKRGKEGILKSAVLAKALLSDGKISFWISIYDRKQLDFYEKKKSAGYSFPAGLSMRRNSEAAHGVDFIVQINDITSDYLPKDIRKSLPEILKDREKYMKTGLFFPPVWFVDVKVEEINRYSKDPDVREN